MVNIQEIGSEFSFDIENTKKKCGEINTLDWLPKGSDRVFAFSGRTAIETVLLDLEAPHKALLPSYCCESMIQPFYMQNIAVEYYSVDLNEEFSIQMQIPTDCDLLLLCNYFGFSCEFPDEQIEMFKKRGGIVVEDITHSLFSVRQYHPYSDYLVASIRKWGALLDGGFCCKLSGILRAKPSKMPDSMYLETKSRALLLKAQYLINGKEKIKGDYLKLFSYCNQYLENNYSSRKMSKLSEEYLCRWNVNEIRRKRKENAHILYEGLNGSAIVHPLFDISLMDCPIFVPVVIEPTKRNLYQQILIENKIFCPIHWPKPRMESCSSLYNIELSLICDQRYSRPDMLRIVQVIKEMQVKL